MEAKDRIRTAKTEGRTALTEAESKEILGRFGVPVVREKVSATPEEAVAAAHGFGFPVVLKGLGAKLTHKTERGLVRLNLRDEGEVRKAALETAAAAGEDLEGYLIQPMLSGRREFVAGLFRDAQFGPVVMFGLGGIFTEALNDVVFRVAPVDEREAEAMIDELRSRKLLGPFRGEQAAQKAGIIRTLTGLSRIGLELPDVTEADINPLLVAPDGQATAVDALMILGERPAVGEDAGGQVDVELGQALGRCADDRGAGRVDGGLADHRHVRMRRRDRFRTGDALVDHDSGDDGQRGQGVRAPPVGGYEATQPGLLAPLLPVVPVGPQPSGVLGHRIPLRTQGLTPLIAHHRDATGASARVVGHRTRMA